MHLPGSIPYVLCLLCFHLGIYKGHCFRINHFPEDNDYDHDSSEYLLRKWKVIPNTQDLTWPEAFLGFSSVECNPSLIHCKRLAQTGWHRAVVTYVQFTLQLTQPWPLGMPISRVSFSQRNARDCGAHSLNIMWKIFKWKLQLSFPDWRGYFTEGIFIRLVYQNRFEEWVPAH